MNYRSFVRVSPVDGAVDASFGPIFSNTSAYTIADAGNGKVYVGGQFTGPVARIARVVAQSDATLQVTCDPASQSLSEGAALQLSGGWTGGSPATFQWKKDGTPIPDATLQSLHLPSVVAMNAGSYTVDVTDSSGTVTSAAATVTVGGMGGGQTFAQFSSGVDWMGKDNSPGGDADMDGIPNIVEFAFGFAPTMNTSGELPQATVKDDMGTEYPAVTFTRDTNVSNVTIQVQAATDLGFTNLLTVMETTEDLGNGLQRVTIRITDAVNANDKVYFRTNVVQN